MSARKRRAPRAKAAKAADPLDAEFGPAAAPENPPEAGRPFGAIPCAGDGCFLKPVADLVSKFTLSVLVRGHGPSLGRAASSGIELMKAMRDFLDEEIALAERAGTKGRPPRVRKIPVE